MTHFIATYLKIVTAFQNEYKTAPVAITSFLLSMPPEMLHFLYYRYQSNQGDQESSIICRLHYNYFIRGLKFVGALNKLYDKNKQVQSFIGRILFKDVFYSLIKMTLQQRATLIHMYSKYLNQSSVKSIPLKDARDWFYYLNSIMSNDNSRICFLKLIWLNDMSEHLNNKWLSLRDPVMFFNALDLYNRSQLHNNIQGSTISISEIQQFVNLVLYVSTNGCLFFLQTHLGKTQKNIDKLFTEYNMRPGVLLLSLNESSYKILCDLYQQSY